MRFIGCMLLGVAVLALVFVFLFGCRTYPREPVAHPPPEPVPEDTEAWAPPSDEIVWRDPALNDTLGHLIEAEPMPAITGPHMLLTLEVPAMMCPNCERAVTHLAQSIPRTRVVAIDFESGMVNLLLPVAASSRVVRLLHTNGWRVAAAESDVEWDWENGGPFRMAEPYQPDNDDNDNDDADPTDQ